MLNGLVLAYGKGNVGVESVRDTRKVFDQMPDRRLACSWSCLISAYARHGLVDDALGLFFRMVGEGVRPEDDTMVGVVSACAKVHGVDIERWVNILFELRGGPFDRIVVNAVDTVLVYLYGKLGKVEDGRALFDEMVGNARGGVSIVAWNCMIGAYVRNDHPVEALRAFHHMRDLGDPQPNHVTVVNLLSACASVGDLELGRWAYEYMRTKRRQGVIESNRILATAFIDMFSKCGSLEEAQKVFEGARDKDIVSFNAMIMGFATNGQQEKALMLFYEMEKCRVKPNEGTFLAILCACTHSGLVDEGRRLFRYMSAKYYIMPNIEHYTCYIDLLARAGHIEEALDVVKTMCIRPNAMVWGALLGACLVHSKVDIAQNVAEKLVSIDPGSSAGYVLLSNVYAFDYTWPSTEEMRGLMKVRGVRKLPGMSWINMGGSLYEFQVGSSSCPQFSDMCSVLNSLSQEMRSTSS